MIDFNFQIRTKLYFGHNREKEIGEILNSYGAHNVLVVTGRSSAQKSGLLDQTIGLIKEAGIKCHVLSGVRANPTTELVYEGIKICHSEKIDFLLAIGGGSAIDTAKAIAVGFYYDGDFFDFNCHLETPTKALPVGSILTISAAGSEMSTSCVIQDDSTGIKSGFNSELIRPVFAIENPELTFTVNKEQTGNGIVDIMMHTLERYFQPSNELELADELSIGLLKNVVKSGRIAIKNPCDHDARANLMLASSLSHNGLTSIGKKFFMPVHQIEHALSGLYPEVAHGAGLSVLFPAWALYYCEYDIDKFDYLARNLFGCNLKDRYQNGIKGIECMKKYFHELGMPTSIHELPVSNIDIEKVVSKLTNDGTRVIGHHKKPMDKEVALEILKIASRKD